MELLRIIAMAMAMIVMLHTDYYSIGEPTSTFCTNEPVKAFAQYLVESVAIVGVNCFVFISGWFSIKPSLRGFMNLIFQLLFYSTLIYFIFVALGLIPFDVLSLLRHSDFFANYWFIRVYVALYLLSPIFNVFVERAGKDMARRTIIIFLVLDIVFGWCVDYMNTSGGYSLFHLSLIYLIARYLRQFGSKLLSYKGWVIYVVISVVTPVAIMLSHEVAPSIWRHAGKSFLYNSPFVIIASICLSLSFTKLRFQSKFVNMIGTSCFAVFLIHGDVLIAEGFLKPICYNIFDNHNILVYSGFVVLLIICFLSMAVLVDQVRQYLWRLIQSRAFPK